MRAFLSAAFLGSWACHQPEPIVYPMRLQPLEEIRAPLPDGEGFPEVLEVVAGGDSDLWWAHGRGYVHASVADTWAALQRPEVTVNHPEVDEWEVTADTEPSFDVSFTVHNTVFDMIRVEYDVTWVEELQGADDAGSPTRVAAQWDKTAGSVFIDLLAGTVVLLPAGDSATEVQLEHHMRAAQRDQDTLSAFLRHVHGNLVAAVRGEAVPPPQ